MFGLGEWHCACQEAGGGAALEVDPVLDTAPVQILILQHVVTVADPLCAHLVDRLQGTNRSEELIDSSLGTPSIV